MEPPENCGSSGAAAISGDAQKIILRWDSTVSNEARERMIFSGDREEADRYLKAVDELQKSLSSTSITAGGGDGENKVNSSTIQIAMARLEDEFRHILLTHSTPVALDPRAAADEDAQNPIKRADSTAGRCEIGLISPEAAADLEAIARRMITGGYLRECSQVYGSVRKSAVDSNLKKLGIEKLSIEEIQRLRWDSVENKIRQWMKPAKICIRVLFSSEKRLSEQIFAGIGSSLDDTFFMEAVKGPAIQLFSFAEAISISPRSPEKMFKILDLHDALMELMPDIEAVFGSKSAESIRVQSAEIVSRLAEAARRILSEFENAVLHEPSLIPVPGGTIHPLTRYVMNYYISLISDYKPTLIELIVSKPSSGSRYSGDSTTPEMDFTELEGKTPLAAHLIWIIVVLQFNLEGKSRHYKDVSLAHVFMMNNVHYIVQKANGSPELREMIGDGYLKKLTGKFRQAAMSYQRATWVRVLYCLREEGLRVNGSASKRVLRERFKSFNAMFEEAHRTQATWLIPEIRLREELRISILENLLPAYRMFLGRFGSLIESRGPLENYIKYIPEELESAVLDLFEGYPISQHLRRRSQ